jgi:hypothetical protein
MPLIDRGNLRDLLAALVIIAITTLLYSLLFAASAHAQFPGGGQPVITIPGSVTSDQPVEQNTANILIQDTITATSVSTPSGAGLFQGQAQFLDAMMQTLASGIPDAGTYLSYFAGWVDFGPNAAMIAATLVNKIIQTDVNTLTVYQSIAANFTAEDQTLGAIEACNQAAGAAQSVLFALQCNTESNINIRQGQQMLELLQVVRGINDAVHRGYDMNTDAQAGANTQTFFTQASQQQ